MEATFSGLVTALQNGDGARITPDIVLMVAGEYVNPPSQPSAAELYAAGVRRQHVFNIECRMRRKDKTWTSKYADSIKRFSAWLSEVRLELAKIEQEEQLAATG